MPTSEQLKNAGKEAGVVVAGAIGSGIVAWVSGWLSEKYSAKEAEKLSEICKLYMIELNAKNEPEHLTLDEHGYPKKKYISNIGSINIGIAPHAGIPT
jgi:fucose permease